MIALENEADRQNFTTQSKEEKKHQGRLGLPKNDEMVQTAFLKAMRDTSLEGTASNSCTLNGLGPHDSLIFPPAASNHTTGKQDVAPRTAAWRILFEKMRTHLKGTKFENVQLAKESINDKMVCTNKYILPSLAAR